MALKQNPGRHRRPTRERTVFGPDGPRRVDPWAPLDTGMRIVGYLLIFLCGCVLMLVLAQVMSA